MGDPRRNRNDQDPKGDARPLALALGDPAGIGAEVTLKALAALQRQAIPVVLVGCRRWMDTHYQALRLCSDAPLADPADFAWLDHPLATSRTSITPGEINAASGAASFAWLTAATELVLEGRCRALVTAPIAKSAWHAAGHPYPGQTERLAELAGVRRASMLFTARPPWGRPGDWRLTTLLATTHIPLANVPGALSPELIAHNLDVLLQFCRRFRARPRLAIAGLNPQAGEGGQLGREENDWITDTVDRWRQQHQDVTLEGPLPPDTCWLEAGAAWQDSNRSAADGFLALDHDQGLLPMKLLALDAAVNTTLGLPFLRSSPDHGTGQAIAGRGVARGTSMAAAIETAWELG
ncbi:MAG: 4-hydroxythreonine-4-phosphate dehydrogenase PdxA [Cyanobacteriota bacterium]